MPHWNGLIDTASPPALEGCKGDPVRVREVIMAEAPLGANVLTISWVNGEDKARVTVEGPNARKYLEETLAATDVVELVSTRERKSQRG